MPNFCLSTRMAVFQLYKSDQWYVTDKNQLPFQPARPPGASVLTAILMYFTHAMSNSKLIVLYYWYFRLCGVQGLPCKLKNQIFQSCVQVRAWCWTRNLLTPSYAEHAPIQQFIDWRCVYYFVRNSSVALLEDAALCASTTALVFRFVETTDVQIAVCNQVTCF